jgi:hypothetical protein
MKWYRNVYILEIPYKQWKFFLSLNNIGRFSVGPTEVAMPSARVKRYHLQIWKFRIDIAKYRKVWGL